MKGLINHAINKLNSFFSQKESPKKDNEYFRNKLLEYSNTRKKYADQDRVPLNLHYYLPWSEGREKHLNGELKCNSALTLFKDLGGHNVEYSEDNIVALTTPGDLNDIVEEIRKSNLLPSTFLLKENEYKIKCEEIKNLRLT